MSTRNGADQPTSGYSYSKGWRQFSRIILHPGLRLLMKHRWQGKENIPSTGGIILAPNHLSYADWPSVAWFSYVYGHRYPVFMIKSAVFEVKVLGPIIYQLGQRLGQLRLAAEQHGAGPGVAEHLGERGAPGPGAHHRGFHAWPEVFGSGSCAASSWLAAVPEEAPSSVRPEERRPPGTARS